jgi:hypothetical protein
MGANPVGDSDSFSDSGVDGWVANQLMNRAELLQRSVPCPLCPKIAVAAAVVPKPSASG